MKARLLYLLALLLAIIGPVVGQTIVRLDGNDIIQVEAVTASNANNLITGINANASGTFNWARVSKTGSSLADLTTRSATDLTSGTLPNARLDADLQTFAGITPSANVQSLLGAADYSAMRTQLGLVIGTNVQAYDADLTTYAGITPAANTQSLLAAANYSAMRTLLTLVPGTDVQAYDADLLSIAGNATGGFLTRTASNTYTARTITGTAGQITVTNGDGVSGAPTISLPTTLTQAIAISGSADTTSSAAIQLKLGLITSSPSNSTDAFVGVHNTGGPGTTAGELLLIPRSTSGVAAGIKFFGNTSGTLSASGMFTAAGTLLVGTHTNSAAGRIELPASTNAADGISFGGDTIYRSAAGVLRTISTFAPRNLLVEFLSGPGIRSTIAGTAGTPEALRLESSANQAIDRGVQQSFYIPNGTSREGVRFVAANSAGAGSGAYLGIWTESSGGTMTEAARFNASQAFIINGTTAATSTTTGSLTTAGGFSAQGAIYAGSLIVSTQAGGAAAAVEGARLTNTTTTGSVYLNLNETNSTATPAYLIRYGSTHATKANVLEVVNAQSNADIRFITTGTGKALSTAPLGGLGYGTGAGGAVTQITSRTTGVTLDKVTGAITLFTAAGSATAASFTVTNSTVAATDTIVLSVKSSTNKYLAFVTAVAAGSFEITFYTTGGTSSDAPVINFAVIKAVAS